MQAEKKYDDFLEAVGRYVAADRIHTDRLQRLVWGTDAGFYRLVPKVVLRVKDEAEMSRILADAHRLDVPVTFRAAGTSLSGQAISDSVLLVAGKNWEDYSISPDATAITMQPGITGGRVDQILAPYGKVFSPDPASKASAMVGGIVANNASGMNCGIHANSDRMLLSLRIVLADGTVLDTGDADSRRAFELSHPNLISGIKRLRDRIMANGKLVDRIRYKYSIKNVTGFNLLPFIQFSDPFDIISHLMVGSEGALAFISQVTMATGHKYPLSASAMLYFSDVTEACRSVVALRQDSPVCSCELLDSQSLAAAGDTTGPNLTALLVEVKADTPDELADKISITQRVLQGFKLYTPIKFSSDPAECAAWWQMRSGIFPAVGGRREPGTTVLIEDIAFHIEDLPAATTALLQVLANNGYSDACIYGHALEGNYHFIIAQRFDTQADIERYVHLMLDIERLVVDRFDGSLKAEHGTGRNMAPFVEREWGSQAWHVMLEIKRLFDPKNLLNPGVIINDDANCFIHNIKAMPLVDKLIDRCIECGFCEVNCVSSGFSMSARQRIVAAREIARLESIGAPEYEIEDLRQVMRYLGTNTCAGDGLCSTSCPMRINTGDYVHVLRGRISPPGSIGYRVGDSAARHLGALSKTLRVALDSAALARRVIGDKGVTLLGKALHAAGLPLWTPSLPAGNHMKLETDVNSLSTSEHGTRSVPLHGCARRVVYFPSCINRTMGGSREAGQPTDEPLTQVMTRLLHRAGYEIIYPDHIDGLCCGMIWDSKGMPDIAERKIKKLEAALWQASEQGTIPVLCDQSPCLHRMREHIDKMHLYEPAEFIELFLAPQLQFKPVDTPIAVHVTCSSRRMGLAETIINLARRCSSRVTVPAEVGCCGFAGDKGFTVPDLNRWALRKLRPALQADNVVAGYSNSRTCEIGLTTNGGVPYRSIVYLVDQVTREGN